MCRFTLISFYSFGVYRRICSSQAETQEECNGFIWWVQRDEAFSVLDSLYLLVTWWRRLSCGSQVFIIFIPHIKESNSHGNYTCESRSWLEKVIFHQNYKEATKFKFSHNLLAKGQEKKYIVLCRDYWFLSKFQQVF